MTLLPIHREELLVITASIREGDAAPRQRERLYELIRQDDDARRFYIRQMHMAASLHWYKSAGELVVGFDAPAEAGVAPEQPINQQPIISPVLGFLGGTARWTREYFSQPGPFSILAAAIFMVCLISILSILPAPTYERSRFNHACTTTDDGSSTTSGTGFQPVKGKFNFVARITGLHNCRWPDNYLPPLRYAHLGLGRELKLDSGLVEITYYNGAKVVLEGPVEFTVEKVNACRLELGKLAAEVPKPAVGFVVQTPTAKIVDLGTEFGVEVEQSGSAEVHIFRGEVLAQLTDRDGAVLRSIRLTEGKAMRFDDTGQTELATDRNAFPRTDVLVSSLAPSTGNKYVNGFEQSNHSGYVVWQTIEGMDGWRRLSGKAENCTICDNPVHDGNQSLRVERSETRFCRRFSEDFGDRVLVDVHLAMDDASNTGETYVYFGTRGLCTEDTVSNADVVVQIGFCDGFIAYRGDAGAKHIGKYVSGAFYRFTAAVNLAEGTWNLRITSDDDPDFTPVGITDIGFRGADARVIEAVLVNNFTATKDIYIDDISVIALPDSAKRRQKVGRVTTRPTSLPQQKGDVPSDNHPETTSVNPTEPSVLTGKEE